MMRSMIFSGSTFGSELPWNICIGDWPPGHGGGGDGLIGDGWHVAGGSDFIAGDGEGG